MKREVARTLTARESEERNLETAGAVGEVFDQDDEEPRQKNETGRWRRAKIRPRASANVSMGQWRWNLVRARGSAMHEEGSQQPGNEAVDAERAQAVGLEE